MGSNKKLVSVGSAHIRKELLLVGSSRRSSGYDGGSSISAFAPDHGGSGIREEGFWSGKDLAYQGMMPGTTTPANLDVILWFSYLVYSLDGTPLTRNRTGTHLELESKLCACPELWTVWAARSLSICSEFEKPRYSRAAVGQGQAGERQPWLLFLQKWREGSPSNFWG